MEDINLIKAKDSFFVKRIKNKEDISGECDGYLIDSSEKEARKIIASLKDKGKRKIIALMGGDDAFNRRVIETLKINYLISPEKNVGRSTLKQRDSGINHVVAKLAKEKGISIVIDLLEVMELKGRLKALRIERIIQNVKICRRAGCSIKVASLATNGKGIVNEKERAAFGISLGMSSEQARDCIKF